MSETAFRTFTRNHFKRDMFNGSIISLSPDSERTYYDDYDTELEAALACRDWNQSHDPTQLYNRMEYIKVIIED